MNQIKLMDSNSYLNFIINTCRKHGWEVLRHQVVQQTNYCIWSLFWSLLPLQ